MPRECGPCNSEKRSQLDLALDSGETSIETGRLFGFDRRAIDRHRRHYRDAMVEAVSIVLTGVPEGPKRGGKGEKERALTRRQRADNASRLVYDVKADMLDLHIELRNLVDQARGFATDAEATTFERRLAAFDRLLKSIDTALNRAQISSGLAILAAEIQQKPPVIMEIAYVAECPECPHCQQGTGAASTPVEATAVYTLEGEAQPIFGRSGVREDDGISTPRLASSYEESGINRATGDAQLSSD